VFCSVACVDAGPLILSSDLSKFAGKLTKTQLKAYLRSKEQRVVDDSGKDVPKFVLIDTLLKYSNEFIDSNDNYTRRSTQKTVHCDFRLLNVLFDDEYTEAFLATGASMSRVELDALNGASAVSFWEVVAEAYNNPENVRFDELLFDVENGINPSLYHNHSAERLQKMWKHLNKLYNEARRRYQKSGNHDPDFLVSISKDSDDIDNIADDFEDFTDYAAVLYLRKHLEQKPGLNELVVRKLDDTIAMESSNGAEQEMKRRESDISSINSSANKKPKKNGMADAIFQLANNRIQVNLDTARLEVMQRKEERLNEIFILEKEKLSVDSDSQKQNNSIQKQKMKVDYLESLFKDNSIDIEDVQKYKDLLKEAREKYLDLLS
jgi:hypothetical protein